jgi:hypothetical protein
MQSTAVLQFDLQKGVFWVRYSKSENIAAVLHVKTSKVKAVQLQAWSGPEGSRKLTFPDFMTTAEDGSKVVSLTHRPPLPPVNIPGTHLC